ncbi:MAG TPA: L-aspartate oxidase [Burkholderiales bacterium]|nr:L-aspartate oxidase [Burkholderiales bacterium]
MLRFDVVIIGSGLAGLTSALNLADHKKVALITKRLLLDGSSNWAQGGIAAAVGENDSIESHINDTLIAGAGLSDPQISLLVAASAPKAINWLINNGVEFDRETDVSKHLHLTREGGHSQRRIVHSADATGGAVQHALAKKVIAHPNISIFEHHIAIDLITGNKLGLPENRCFGAYIFNSRSGKVITFQSDYTILATGGAGKVYLYTTNPDVSTGDGIAMGWRAGCDVANMEFIQFHPTCLYHPHAKSFLISESVRGEGGILRLPDGERFMPWHDERGELAPRDIVARAIDFEMKKRGLDCVYLDITHKGEEFIKTHFPTIYARCLTFGIDITNVPIPVVPAAHYLCGGLLTDEKACTSIPNLYAVGEVACTGLHGANRLASNSLLECIVFAFSAAQDILVSSKPARPVLPPWDESRVTDADEEIVIAHNWEELRRFMWDYVGIVRTTKRLTRAMHRIELLREEIDEFYSNYRVSHDLLELRNLVVTADLIVRSALARKESRGLHYSRDYPHQLEIALPTILHSLPETSKSISFV